MSSNHFADQLVLARWALQQLGVDDFDRLSTMLRAPELEGWASDGGTHFVHQLIARLPKYGQGRSLSDDQLRTYDSNIVAHWKHITRKRNLLGPTLYPLYFQYLSLLVTDLYLDRYFHNRADLLAALKRGDIRLESFLISQTYRNDLRWPSPAAPDRQASLAEYRSHHILCAKDDPDTYVRDLVALIYTE